MRPREPEEPVRRFETPPGHQGQVDFADFRLPWGKRHALVVVLGYSRLMWLGYYERQTMRVVMRGLESSFAYFGGVPSELLVRPAPWPNSSTPSRRPGLPVTSTGASRPSPTRRC